MPARRKKGWMSFIPKGQADEGIVFYIWTELATAATGLDGMVASQGLK
jgi:hypothetical protein